MNIDQWINLTAEKRNELRREWQLDADRWTPLLDELQTRFVQKYGSHPLINRIDATTGTHPFNEPGLVVVTALYPPQRIEELPDRFLTFRIEQEPVEAVKEYYIHSWELILGNLLDWSSEQVRQWALRFEPELNTYCWTIYHDPPVCHVTRELIPPTLRERLKPGPEGWLKLEFSLQEIIGDPIHTSPYDWAEVKARYLATLADAEANLTRS